jgi:hypothetical protein
MNDILKWVGKLVLQSIMWVFILSIQWDGRSLFYHANETLVQNQFVRNVDEELAQLWTRFRRSAKMTFSEPAPEDQKSM